MAISTATGAQQAPASVTPFRRAPIAVFALVGLMVIWSFVDPAGIDDLAPIGVMGGIGVAGVLLMRSRSRLPAGEGRSWFLVGMGMVAAAVGILIVGVIDAVTAQADAFGPTDLIFGLTYVAVTYGLATMPHVRGGPVERLRVWLDGLIGAVSLGTVLWVLFLAEPFSQISGVPLWQGIVGAAYPIIDVAALIVLMIVTVRRSSLRFDLRLMLLGVGLASQAVADISYLETGIGQSFTDASPDYRFYLLAALCYLGTGLLATRRPAEREYADRRASLLPMIAPYGAAVVLVVLLMSHIRGSTLDGPTTGLLLATLVVGALVVARQTVAIRENRQLVERQRASLVSSISHELRTPLTAMMGFLELLDEGEETVGAEEREELTGIVHQQAVYMSRIVADLIMLARGDPSEIILVEEEVPVRQAISAAIRAVADTRGAIDVSCPGDLVVLADPDRMQQVLVNLLSNAVRYGGEYRAVVARVERDDVVLEVHDNGPGVAARHVLTIWERFERGPNRYNATTPGSGIGLAVVEAVAKAHGGSAEYERSALLGGACFRVRLPGRRYAVTPPEPRLSTAADGGTTAA